MLSNNERALRGQITYLRLLADEMLYQVVTKHDPETIRDGARKIKLVSDKLSTNVEDYWRR